MLKSGNLITCFKCNRYLHRNEDKRKLLLKFTFFPFQMGIISSISLPSSVLAKFYNKPSKGSQSGTIYLGTPKFSILTNPQGDLER